jgi:uncharacterized membrane protein
MALTATINVSERERLASTLGGALLALYGYRHPSFGGALLAASGSALIARGTTGYCPVYASVGYSTARRSDTRSALGGSRGVNVEESVTINCQPDTLYERWRRLEDLPHVMSHLVSVTPLGDGRTHWVAKAPGNRTVEWDAEIINEVPNRLIAWKSVEDADVVSAGSVSFLPVAGGRGTELRVKMQYEPPGQKAGAVLAWALGGSAAQSIREDLRHFKALMEAGEIPTVEGQPRGEASVLNYD